MRKIHLDHSILQTTYLIIYILLFSVIILTPSLISGPLFLTKKIIIGEEILEGSLLFILFILGIFIYKLYEREIDKHKELIKSAHNDKKIIEGQLLDSLKYIGKVNIQIQEFKSIFDITNKYPETINDFKKVLHSLTHRVLGIVNTNWILFRIVDSNTGKTLSECFQTRQNVSPNYPLISNKMILEAKPIPSSKILISHPQNLNTLVFCVLPVEEISRDQNIFIQAILNEITMLYIIFNFLRLKNQDQLK